MIRGFPNGATQPVEDRLSAARRKHTRGTETSKYPEEKKTISDSLSSGERKGNSPNRDRFGGPGVVGPRRGRRIHSGTLLESWTIAGDSPVHGMNAIPSGILSRAGHVRSCLNPAEPSAKAKYC